MSFFKKIFCCIAIIISLASTNVQNANFISQESRSYFKRYTINFYSPTYYYSNGCTAQMVVIISFDWDGSQTSNEEIEDIRIIAQCPDEPGTEYFARAAFTFNQSKGLVQSIQLTNSTTHPSYIQQIFNDTQFIQQIINGINADLLSQQ